MKKKNVIIIELVGGLVDRVIAPKGMEVHILDHENDGGLPEDLCNCSLSEEEHDHRSWDCEAITPAITATALKWEPEGRKP